MKNYLILLVDDEPENLQAIHHAIKGARGAYKVICAVNGKMAYHAAEKRQPDLIIADWMMPGMDGLELVTLLQKNPNTVDIPVIMCTGVMTTPKDLGMALDAGAVDYIRKPIEPIELCARINSMLKLSDSKKEIKAQKEELEKTNYNLKLLSDIGKDILSNTNAETIIDTAYENLNILMDASVFTIGLYNKANNSIEFPATREQGQKLPAHIISLEDTAQIGVQCYRNCQEIVLTTHAESRRMFPNRVPIGKSTASIIYLPLHSTQGLMGVISIQSFLPNAYTPNQLHLVRNIAIYCGIALDNASTIKHIESQKIKIEYAHRQMTESINYASQIQRALLPSMQVFTAAFPENFVLYKPRDIVSGDFYWIQEIAKLTLVAAADCTGHGVPGAFMSMLGISFLNEIVTHRNARIPGQILNELRSKVKSALKQDDKNNKTVSGMDIALCSISIEEKIVYFAGAHNPLYIVRKATEHSESELYQLIEVKAIPQHIGKGPKEKPFHTQKIKVQPKDKLYMFSDGYVDQFGGPQGFKFLLRNFKQLLTNIAHLPMQAQKDALNKQLNDWMGSTNKQIDDILVMGIEIP